MGNIYGKGLKAKATQLHAQIIRSTGRCENCGKGPEYVQLQCAHIISRRFSHTRTDLRNAFCLCAACHRYYTDYPREFSRFITKTWAQEFYDDVLLPLSRERLAKLNWQDRLDFLKDIKKRIDNKTLTLEEARRLEC